MRRFLLYVFRWQLSTPILWLAVRQLGAGIGATVIANLIGATIFFWVDRFIFTSKAVELWHYREFGLCGVCGKKEGLWRLVRTGDYDKTDAAPVFLCQRCSKEKLKELQAKGIEAEFAPK